MSISSKDKNPYLLTLPQLMSAKSKISKVAEFYDPKSNALRAFDTQRLGFYLFCLYIFYLFLIKQILQSLENNLEETFEYN